VLAKDLAFLFFGIVCAWDLVEDNILKLQMSDWIPTYTSRRTGVFFPSGWQPRKQQERRINVQEEKNFGLCWSQHRYFQAMQAIKQITIRVLQQSVRSCVCLYCSAKDKAGLTWSQHVRSYIVISTNYTNILRCSITDSLIFFQNHENNVVSIN